MATISNKKQYILNLLSSYGGSIVAAVVGIISAPISLGYWQVEKYGIFAVIASISAYISISGFSIDTACGILMTKNSSSDKKLRIYIKSMKALIICSGTFLFLFLLSLFMFPDWLRVLGKMTEETYLVARKAAIVSIVFIFINTPFSAVACAIGAYQRSYTNNILNAFSPLVSLGVLLFTVHYKFDMFLNSLITGVFFTLISIIRLFLLASARRLYHSVETDDVIQNDDDYRTILKTGWNLTFSGLATVASANIGNIIISNMISASSVAPYSLAVRLFSLAYMFLTMTNVSASPLLGKEFALKNWDWIKRTYQGLLVATLFLGGMIWVGGVLFLRPLILVWVGAVGYPGILTIVLLGAYYFFCGLSNFNWVLINAFNYTRRIGLVSWAESIITILTTLVCIKYFGASSPAFGLLAGTAVVSAWALPFVVYRRSNGRLFYDKKIITNASSITIITVALAIVIDFILPESALKLVIRVFVLFAYVGFLLAVHKDELLFIVSRVRRR
jgi:O-antigen/teichoic acid export membrane protein